MDTVSKKERSAIMAKIKSTDSKIERDFSKALWNAGFRYRKNVSKYFGKPDFVLKKYRTVIFVDSCFWHGCRRHCRIPSVRKNYWRQKIAKNSTRDKEVLKHYKKQGWKIFRIWEHNIKNDPQKVIKGVINFLN